jgi:hypothetical protein
MRRQCGIVKAREMRVWDCAVPSIRAEADLAGRSQIRPSTMAPTKASDRYAVRVLNVPNVVMGHLPILRAFTRNDLLNRIGFGWFLGKSGFDVASRRLRRSTEAHG